MKELTGEVYKTNVSPLSSTAVTLSHNLSDTAIAVGQQRNALLTKASIEAVGMSLGNATGNLCLTRYLDDLSPLTKMEIAVSFYQWLRSPGILVFKSKYWYSFKYSDKRGNAGYTKKVNERWGEFDIENYTPFFDPKSRALKSTPMLYQTLTNNCEGSVRDSWLEIGEKLNLYFSNVRKKFGKFHVARCFESFYNGYPHIHLVLYFEDHRFPIAFEQTKDGHRIYRIMGREWFQNHWDAFVDIQGCYDNNVIYYLTKHNKKFSETITKKSDDKHLLTLSRCWLYRKRSFSVSRELFDRLDYCSITNSNPEILNSSEKTEFVGMAFPRRGEDLGITEGWWHKFPVDHVPDVLKEKIVEAEDWSIRRAENKQSEVDLSRLGFNRGTKY